MKYFLNYILELLKILLSSWQLVVLILIIIFRDNIKLLISVCTSKIGNINKLKLGELEMETMDQVIEEYPIKDEIVTKSFSLEQDFIKVCMQFETTIKEKLSDINNHNIRNLLNNATKEKIITNQEKKALNNMFRFKNLILHHDAISIQDSELAYCIEFLQSMLVKLDRKN